MISLIAESLLLGIAIYLSILWVGRWLKRSFQVHLGIIYQLFAVMLAAQTAAALVNLELPWPQERLALLGMLGALVSISLQRRFFWEIYLARRRGAALPRLLPDLVGVLIFVLAVVLVASLIYGVQIPGLLAGSGILAAIIGLAMQDLLGNLIAGSAIQIGRPFKIGDWLLLDGRHLEVREINWRSTRLRDNDHTYVDVPNSDIVKQSVVNFHYPDRVHAQRFTVRLEYSVPPNRAKDALIQAARNGSGVLKEPPPSVLLKEFGDHAILYEVRFWIDNHAIFNDALDSIQTNIWYEFQRRHLHIPFPIRTVEIQRSHQRHSRGQKLHALARETLRQQDLFQALDERSLEDILSRSRILSFGRRERIVEQGAPGDSMFVLVRGQAEVLVRLVDHAEPTLVGSLSEGDYFGEMSLLSGEPRTATVRVREDCDVLEIRKDVVADAVRRTPELLDKLSAVLAERRLANDTLRSENPMPLTLSKKATEYRQGFADKLKAFFSV